MGLLSLEETEKAGPDAELTAVSSNTHGKRDTTSEAGRLLGKTVQSHQGLCHERWSNSAQPGTEVWRREVKGRGAP